MNTTVKHVRNRRLGVVEFPLQQMIEAPGSFAEVVGKLAIVTAYADIHRGVVVYVVWHPSLPLVSECEVTPGYSVMLFDNRLVFSPSARASAPVFHLPTLTDPVPAAASM